MMLLFRGKQKKFCHLVVYFSVTTKTVIYSVSLYRGVSALSELKCMFFPESVNNSFDLIISLKNEQRKGM